MQNLAQRVRLRTDYMLDATRLTDEGVEEHEQLDWESLQIAIDRFVSAFRDELKGDE